MTNEGWPEAFGFSVTSDAPVLISDVEEGGSAQQAGLQIGDAIIELDAENVEKWMRDQVIERARYSVKVPPSLIVMSRVRQFVIHRTKDGGCGFTVRGNSPVFIRSVDFHTSARIAGLRSGDLLLEINGYNVRYAAKLDVLELLKRSGYVLHVMVVAGGLWATPYPSSQVKTKRPLISKEMVEKRHMKAKAFQSKVNYYLLDDPMKKTHLYTLLRLYTKSRNIDSLATSLDILLDSPIERRLFTDIRSFIHPSDVAKFDAHLSYSLGSANGHRRSVDLESVDGPYPLRASDRGSPWRSSLPNLTQEGERFVPVYRGSGGFGFTLSGNAPVFIRSVDRGGAAAMAGLKAGDRLLQLNGLNIRNATHSHVVRLLRGSGTRPTLVVSSAPQGMTTPPAGGGGGGGGGRRASATNVGGRPSGNGSVKKHSQDFKEKMEQVLFEEERQHVLQQLTRYSQNRDIPELIGDLGEVLKEPNKAVLFHYICQLLPHEVQAEFDRIAAASLAGEPISTTARGTGLKLGGAPGDSASTKGGGAVLASANQVGGAGFGIAGCFGVGGASLDPGGGLVLQDTPIRGVGVANTSLSRETPPTKPSGSQSLDEQLSSAISGRGQRTKDLPSTPPTVGGAAAADVSAFSTPGLPMPPNPPPTPQGGIPVPPPPPPALPGGAQTQRSNLKRVNWEKIHGTEGTIWRELSGLEEALEYYEIEEKFSRQKPKDAVQGKIGKKTAILEPRKAYNISILLGHLKMPFSKIKEAILSCDENVLSEQHLRQMESFAPDDKECLGFARHYDNPGVLSIPDQFSCEMSTIPCYRERLRAMIFKLHFRDKLEEIKPDLEAISLASVQLQTSKLFKKVLEVILAVGNYMNAGNVRVGGAIGFRISFLTQLKTLRTTDNKSSLLHFVANVVERKFPHVLEFPDDLSYAIKAARVSGQTLEVEVSELTQGLNDIRTDIKELGSREQLEGDRFTEIMTGFISEAETEMKSLLRLYGHMKQEYIKAVKFFGEDLDKMRIDEFFSAFASFIEDFKKAVEDNKVAREKEVEMEKRKQEKEHLTKKQKPNKPAHHGDLLERREAAEDFRKELQQRSQGINVASIDERVGSKSAAKLLPQQQDFRHILRPLRQTDNDRPTATPDHNEMASSSSSSRFDREHQWQRGDTFPQHQLRRVNAAGEEPCSGGVGPHSGGVGPRSGGVGPHFVGVGPRSGGVGPHSGVVGARSGGVGPHSGGVGPHSGGVGPHFGGLEPCFGPIGPRSGGTFHQTGQTVSAAVSGQLVYTQRPSRDLEEVVETRTTGVRTQLRHYSHERDFKDDFETQF